MPSIRERLIEPYVTGKDVLDVGSVGQTHAYNLWQWLREKSGSLVGIDTEPSSDPAMVEGDMEDHAFGRTFDVVMAGDVVEHLANPGLFLDNVLRHLKPDGRLLITTPNAKWWTVVFKPNPTHTLWHDRYTLTYLLSTHGLTVERFVYYPGNKRYPWWLRLLLKRQAMFVVGRRTT